METIFLGVAIYLMFRLLYQMAIKAGIFDRDQDPATIPIAVEAAKVEVAAPKRAEKFVRLETATEQEYDNIFVVGGFASYEGRAGQVVYLSGGMAKIEIFSDCGDSKKSDIIDVPISALNPVTQITWKTIK